MLTPRVAGARCRHVSRFFKKATELAFLSEVLPRMVVNLNLTGTHAWGERNRAILELKGFSHAGDRVYFAEKDRSLKDMATYKYQVQNGSQPRPPRTAVVDWNRHLPLGGAQSPPILIEWASFLSISVCRGPRSYYDWTSSRDQVQHAFFPAGTAPSVRCHTHHTAAEVSFLWKEMLNISFARFRLPRAQMARLGAEAH